jgi:hypothetical protein
MPDIAYGSSTDPNLPPIDLPTLGQPRQIPNIIVGPRQRVAESASSDFPAFSVDKLPGAPEGGSASSDFPAYKADEKKAAAPKPEQTTSTAQRIAIDFMNQQAAAGQRTTGMIALHEPNLLGNASVDELNNLGYKDEGGQFQPFDQSQHVVLTDPTDNTTKVYRRSEATDRGLLTSAGTMLGTMQGPGNIMVSKAAPAAVQAATRLGVDVPKAITTEQPLTRFSGQAVARLPGGGPLQEAIPESITGLEQKVQDIAKQAGGTTSQAVTGEEFRQAVAGEGPYATTGFKPQQKDITGRAYDAIEKLINPGQRHPLTETLNTAQDIINRRGAGALAGEGSAAQVMEGITRPDGLTYSGIKDLRSNIGEMLQNKTFPEGFSEAELRRLYGSLSDDLRSAVATGGPRASAAFERANGIAERFFDWKKLLEGKILGPSTRSGEGITQAILRMAQEGGDEKGLAIARTSVPPDVWKNVASTAISQLGKNRVGVWTPAQFLSDYRSLSQVGRQVLFGGAGSGQVIPQLSDLAKVSDAFKEAGKLANVSGTAGHNEFWTAVTSLMGGIAAVPALGPKALAAPVVAIGGMLGNNLMARALSTPATLSSIGRWARVYQTVAERPTPAGMAAFVRTAGELANTINGSLGTQFTARDILQSTVQGEGKRNERPQ